MTISGASSSVPATPTDRGILALKKQQDSQKVQAEALVELINNAPTPAPGVGTRLNVYA